MATNISFNGNSLQSNNIITNTIDHGSTPDNSINILKLAKAPRSTITSALKQQKTVKLSGTVFSTTGSISDCDAQIDTFKGYLIGADKNLDIDYNGVTRRYIATQNKTVIQRPGNLAWATFDAEFICSQPYGLDTTATTLVTASGRTSSSYSDSITVGGNAEWQTPIITITYTALTGGTNALVYVGNAATGQQITITRTWATNDVLVIDTSSLTLPVSVNGAAIPFTGALPVFNTGPQILTYSDTLATRTFNILCQSFNKWD